MDAVVVGQLGMERRGDQRAVPHQHRLPVDAREYVHVAAGALDHRCPDEHRVEGAVVQARHDEIALEAVDLPAERVAPDIDVEHGEAALIVSPVEHVRCEEDHAGAGAERRKPAGQPLGHRGAEPRRVEQQGHGGGLASGEDERIDAVEIGWDADLSRVSAEGAENAGVGGERPLQRKDADLHLEASDASAHECRGDHCARAPSRGQAGAMSERSEPTPATTIDRFHGVEPGPGAVASALATQRARMLELFRTFDDRQWQAATRCSDWTVHHVARHLVDVANLDSALQRGEGPRTPDGRIDPRADPATWLAASDGQTPAETVAAFEVAAEAERAAFEGRIREGGDELLPGPYGPLHWAALGAHLFWDGWLHERDVVVPLGLPHEPTLAEDRLAALYALTISSTAPTFFGSTLTFSIELTGCAPGVYDDRRVGRRNPRVVRRRERRSRAARRPRTVARLTLGPRCGCRRRRRRAR